MTDRAAAQRLARPDGATIAYHAHHGKLPGAVFCGGFNSDMGGTKALALEQACLAEGRSYIRFDYFGHGQSTGAFAEGTIGRWRDDCLAVLDLVAQGPQVLVGSSMGGWLATLAALARPGKVAGLVLIAPALDFTERLMRPGLPAEALAALERDGVWIRPSPYGPDGYPITRRLLDEGRDHLLLDRPVPYAGPVRILQGMEDPDVPWRHALDTVAAFAGGDVQLTLIKDGDHRLSRPQDLNLLEQSVAAMLAAIGG